jgi:hypothetical protein
MKACIKRFEFFSSLEDLQLVKDVGGASYSLVV